jgi:hypothetical protein
MSELPEGSSSGGGVSFERGPISAYFGELKAITTHPVRFYRELALRPDTGVAAPIAFGLVSHWLGRAMSQLWKMGLNLESTSASWFLPKDLGQIEVLGRQAHWHEAQARLQEWMSGVGSVVADPFITLLLILIGACLLFLSARLFIGAPGPQRPASAVTLNSTLKIVAYSQAASLLWIVPGWGGALSSIGAFVLIWAGVREFYQVSGGRALITALFSKISVALIVAALALVAVIGLATLLFLRVLI